MLSSLYIDNGCKVGDLLTGCTSNLIYLNKGLNIMAESLLTTLSIENHPLSTLLSMDLSSLSHDDLVREMNHSVLTQPPDINVPLSYEPSSPLQVWNDSCDILEVGLGPQIYEAVAGVNLPKAARKCSKRLDGVWGAWFFFSFYFKPVLIEKSKCKIIRDNNGVSGYEKSDLQLDAFLVQHDMENMYMWVFKERPENALGKMQLRSYMNGHSRHGERPFPFSADKGFVRSHRMQRKHYRGLSNPQCVHGIEVVRSPNLVCLNEEERKRWVELTGRDMNFSIPLGASDFGSWRNLQTMEFEIERPHPHSKTIIGSQQRKVLNGPSLNLSTHSSDNSNGDGMDFCPISNKRKKDFIPHGSDDDCCLTNNSHYDKLLDMKKIHPVEPPWLKLNEFSGVMKNVNGPVTAAKTIYEDDDGFLIIVSLPFADLQRVKVTWRNAHSHGIVKISCVSTACMPFIKRDDRTFKLTDPTPEHCPPGEFIREIPLPTRIPEDANLEAYCDETGTTLEIIVPKHRVGPEEHEVRVCLRPYPPWCERPFVDLKEALV
ncbi:HSP20-like chaperones superfamily protein [Quillaja saponaria]|uniref:HSP20-like chaperones superfamily protein n=1 Tax=Quillaja saponaria TaxID=32244 RepID=A0AAD7Q6M6_QUISA|nr:HSP20-like chaperones superfamily protein [Quillaja saponaria]